MSRVAAAALLTILAACASPTEPAEFPVIRPQVPDEELPLSDDRGVQIYVPPWSLLADLSVEPRVGPAFELRHRVWRVRDVRNGDGVRWAVLAPDERTAGASFESVEVGFCAGPRFVREDVRQQVAAALSRHADVGVRVVETSTDYELYEWQGTDRQTHEPVGGLLYIRAAFTQPAGVNCSAYTLRGVPLPDDAWVKWYPLAFEVPWHLVPCRDEPVLASGDVMSPAACLSLWSPSVVPRPKD